MSDREFMDLWTAVIAVFAVTAMAILFAGWVGII